MVHQQLKLKSFGILASIDFVISVMRLCTECQLAKKRLCILDNSLFWKMTESPCMLCMCDRPNDVPMLTLGLGCSMLYQAKLVDCPTLTPEHCNESSKH